MTFPTTNDNSANRELSIEDLEPVAAGVECIGGQVTLSWYRFPARHNPEVVLPGTGSIFTNTPQKLF
jgi:hypothetical protein